MELEDSIRAIENKKEHPVVFVCGLGGAGKTTFAKQLVAQNPGSILLHLDWYATYPTKERKKRIAEAVESEDPVRIEQEENPKNWYSWEEFKKDLRQLQRDGDIDIRSAWNQANGEKDLDVKLSFGGKKDGFIICEGIYLLHPDVAVMGDLIILLDISVEEARRRAESRDDHRSSPEYLAYKASLTAKYDLPYFAQNKGAADVVLSERDTPKFV